MLSVVNISVALFVIFGGVVFSNASNWTYPDGFTPFGVSSVFKGAAKAYFAFVGYNSVAIASEEAKNPAFSVPFALGFVIIFVTILYCSIAAALASMLPYTEINEKAPFADVFDQNGWPWAKFVVSIGATGAMACVIVAFGLTMPRCIYAMADDGLIFKKLAKVYKKTQVPLLSTALGIMVACVFAFFLSLDALVDFMSIGSLLAYIIVTLALIVLRYSPRDVLNCDENALGTERSKLLSSQDRLQPKQAKLLVIMIVLIVAVNILLAFVDDVPENYRCPIYSLTGILFLLLIGDLVTLSVVSKDCSESSYCRVPFVPFLPALSIFINFYLMAQLDFWTWIRLGAWLLVGFFIYFIYGIENSTVEDSGDMQQIQDATDSDDCTA